MAQFTKALIIHLIASRGRIHPVSLQIKLVCTSIIIYFTGLAWIAYLILFEQRAAKTGDIGNFAVAISFNRMQKSMAPVVWEGIVCRQFASFSGCLRA